jgi:hypothetical protein
VIGRKKLPEKFTSAINPEGKFSHTPYTVPALIKVSEKLVRQAVIRCGGRIEKDSSGKEVLVIPVIRPKPGKLEQCWEPGPAAGSKFTDEEMEQITAGSVDKRMQKVVDRVYPGWKISRCGQDMDPGLRAEYRGKKNVLMTHPLNRETGCILSRKVEIPAGKKTTLRLVVAPDSRGDWTLLVKAGGERILKKKISGETASNGWVEVEADLSGRAGKSVKLELVNQADDWQFEAGYWAEISLASK